MSFPNVNDNICRVCLSGKTFMFPISKKIERVSFADRITMCSSINVQVGDIYPQYICASCIKNLDISYQFRIMCQESEKKLQEAYNTNVETKTESGSVIINYELDISYCPESETDDIHNKIDDPFIIVKEECKDYSSNENDCIDTNLLENNLQPIPPGTSETKVQDGTQLSVNAKSTNVFITKLQDDRKALVNKKTTTNQTLQEKELIASDDAKVLLDSKIDNLSMKVSTKGSIHKNSYEKCPHCDKLLIRYNIKRHIMSVHNRIYRFNCPKCPRKFTENQTLQTHLKLHSESKDYLCGVCGEAFTQRTGLSQHERKHEGHKFKCPQCPRTFIRTTPYKIHLLTHTGERNFECDKCGKKFYSKSDLARHKGTHTGISRIKCEVCGIVLSQRSQLGRHMLIHSGIRKHQCEVCEARFTQKSDMKKHVLRHLKKNETP